MNHRILGILNKYYGHSEDRITRSNGSVTLFKKHHMISFNYKKDLNENEVIATIKSNVRNFIREKNCNFKIKLAQRDVPDNRLVIHTVEDHSVYFLKKNIYYKNSHSLSDVMRSKNFLLQSVGEEGNYIISFRSYEDLRDIKEGF